MKVGSLWDENFILREDTREQAARIASKKKNPKQITVEKLVNSKSIPIEEKLRMVREEVYRILGVYKENTRVIHTYDELKTFIDHALDCGIIAVDTETNKSLDPITAKLVGACLYIPTEKQVYVPISHTDLIGRPLENQVTIEQLKEQFGRLKDIKIVYHNAKFDYEVIHFTVGVDLPIYWDTMIGAKILNENEEAGLKYQYISKIDPSIEKYSIEHLFKTVDYEVVSPEVFALYAATDSFMTYKLYQWQLEQFNLPNNKGIYKLFKEVEMPVVEVYASMEIRGMRIDKAYAKRIKEKYQSLLDDIDKEILEELHKLDDTIAAWRKTPEAKEPIRSYPNEPERKKLADPMVSKEEKDAIREKYPYYDTDVESYYRKGKSKSEQLSDPVAISSPTQLAILLYDVLKTPVIDKKTPRGTGEKIIEQIDLPICKLITKSKKMTKLMTAFIEPLPGKFTSKVDDKVHCSFNQLGTVTGRCSCTSPNMQQVPAKSKDIRMMFEADTRYFETEETNDYFEVDKVSDIQLADGEWVNVKNVVIGMEVALEDSNSTITDLVDNGNSILIYCA